jgi:hypothetical protein
VLGAIAETVPGELRAGPGKGGLGKGAIARLDEEEAGHRFALAAQA